MKTRASRLLAKNTNRLRGGVVPIGGIILTASASIPDGMLICDGSAVSRADYPALFQAIGTEFGEGDGSTTFNVPSLQAPAPGLRYLIRFGNTLAQLEEAKDW